MLIPVHHILGASNKRRGRSIAIVIGYAIVDEDMGHLSNEFWTVTSNGYARTHRGGKSLFMHHAIIGKREGFDVSHENANTLDNRRSNLMHCSRSDNMLNPADGARRSNKSCFIRGISRDDLGRNLAKPWRGKVSVLGKTYQTRRYATPEEAAVALDHLRADLRVREFPK